MPRTNSILTKDGGVKVAYGCCEHLHKSPYLWTGMVPLKYMYSHKDISILFESWMKFLQNELELDMKYELSKETVRGWRSLKQFEEEVSEWIYKDYVATSNSIVKYPGIISRRDNTVITVDPNKELVCATYNRFLLNNPSRDLGGKLLREDKRLPSFTMPVANVRLLGENLTDRNHNMMYISWYMVRLIQEYLFIPAFIIKHKEELNAIREKYKLEWYNILYAILEVFYISTKVNISNPINRKLIEEALGEAITAHIELRGSFDRYSNRIVVDTALKTYFGVRRVSPMHPFSGNIVDKLFELDGNIKKEYVPQVLKNVELYISNSITDRKQCTQ